MDWHVVLRFLAYLLPHWRLLLVTWLLSLMILGLQGITIWVGADFVQTLLGGASDAPLHGAGLSGMLDRVADLLLRRSTPMATLLAAVAVLVMAGVGVAVLRVVKLAILARVNQSALAAIRIDLFARITRLPISFNLATRHGEVVSLFVRDVDELHYLFIDLTDRVFMQPLRLLFAAYLMFELSAELALWSMLVFLPTAILVHRVGRRMQELSRGVLERVAELQAHLTEYLSSAMLARSFGREDREQEGFVRNAGNLRDAQCGIMVMDAIGPQVLRVAVVIGGGALLLIGGRQVLVTQSLDAATLTRLVLLLPMVALPLEALASLYVSLRRSAASAGRLGMILQVEGTERGGAARVELLERGITLRAVDYAASGVPVLERFSATIPARGVTVLEGASGSGKTTLMNLLAGFLRPQGGVVEIDGRDFKELDAVAWAERLGIVHQEPLLLNASIRENLTYAAPGAQEAELISALARAGLWEKVGALPAGLDTMVGNRGGMLSGGERQRLAVARALLRRPMVWLFDEPTAHLDDENRKRVIATIRELAREAAVVVATHDPALMEMADQRVDLDLARVPAGAPRECAA